MLHHVEGKNLGAEREETSTVMGGAIQGAEIAMTFGGIKWSKLYSKNLSVCLSLFLPTSCLVLQI